MGQLIAIVIALFASALQAAQPSSASGRVAEQRVAAPRASAPTPTLRQLVGQHMVFAYDGLRPPAALRRRIARGEAAGVILFARNVRSVGQVRDVVLSLQAIKRPRGLRAPLLVMVDQEGGPVRRLPGAPRRAATQVSSSEQARADGRAAARVLRSAGANMNLAPVADVGRSGSALLGERRVYGTSPGRVASFAGSFVTGSHDGGVRATAKHFPGFGAASVNTDDAPARIGASLATLRRVDERPFAALIKRKVDAVMVSTAVYPALDDLPAAFSSRWVTGELRRRMGFRGVTITDDLGTPAVRAFGSNARRAVLAVRAGVDLPLFSSSYRDSARAAEGLLAQARRVLALRAKLPR